jgi:hypothetical protein|tara:strand:- start:6340 stop:6543 length:204 start_codon:yes stop_codon:yes gene_type:complete
MSFQEIYLFVPSTIYYFGLALFEVTTLGHEIDIACIFFISVLFWIKIYHGVLVLLKKVLRIQQGAGR